MSDDIITALAGSAGPVDMPGRLRELTLYCQRAEREIDELRAELERLQAAADAKAAPAEPTPPADMLVNGGALRMVLNALRRDAAEGKTARGEMADELERTAHAAPTVTQPLTDAQIDALSDETSDLLLVVPDELVGSRTLDRMFARAIEHAHGITGDAA